MEKAKEIFDPDGRGARYTRSKAQKNLNGTLYHESTGFKPGVLPVKKDIIQSMMYLLAKGRAGKSQRTVDEAARLLAYITMEHWEYCTLYTVKIQHIQKKILKLYTTFKDFVQTRAAKQTESWKAKVNLFNKDMDTLFDIFATDDNARKKMEESKGVEMGPDEWMFLDDQRTGRKMYCEEFLDRVWVAQMEARKKKEERQERLRKSKEDWEQIVKPVSWENVELIGDSDNNNDKKKGKEDSGPEYVDNPDFQEQNIPDNPSAKKRRIMSSEAASYEKDDLPYKYCHLRENVRTVKPSFYRTVDKIKSKYHCSNNQAVGSILETANGMFERQWKFFDEDEAVIDLDTAPHTKMIRETGKALTALCLSEIVEEMMSGGGGVITYHDDGSRSQGVGGYSVQGITINGKFRPFPALPISSECRTNLATLKITLLNILAACNTNYKPKEIYEAVTFKVTDATAHNFEVDEIVAMELGSEYIPEHLLCHTHPSLMFNRVIINTVGKIEKEIGPDKIYSSMLVNATTSHDSVLEQYIDCTVRLVSTDFNHKSWNKSSEFGLFIGAEKNKAKALKKERFNRFVYLAAVVLHHQPQIQDFLAKYDTITNTLACIVRAFEECEFLSVLLAVAAVLGIHLVEPYLSVTYFDPPKYEDLIPIMRQLYKDLKTTDTKDLLDISKPAFSFIDEKRFKECIKWDKDVLKSLKDNIAIHSEKIVDVLSLILPELAQGFFVQRGDVFGFGPFDPDSDKLVTRIDLQKLNQAPINNLDSERAVGSVNYELGVRGATQLKAASDALVKNKSYDLIELHPADAYKDFKDAAKVVNNLVKDWKEKQMELQQSGLEKKEVESMACDRRKMGDLDWLKAEGGPFTKAEQVDKFVAKKDITEKEKQAQLYKEVRYARDSSLSLPKTSDIFKLKENYKPLSVDRFSKNLKVYLSKVTTNASVSWEDFDHAVSVLKSAKL